MNDIRQPGPLYRLLAFFGDVRAGEGGTVLLMSLNVFLLLVAYYVLKLAAGVVFLGTHLLSFGVPGFARANIAVVLIAIGVAVLLLREYRRLTAPVPGQPSNLGRATILERSGR